MAIFHKEITKGVVNILDHGFVGLYQQCANDLSVVNSARISFDTRHEEIEDSDHGLINYLMKNRHGCYDDATEVLTDKGWISWPEVTGEEQFFSIGRNGTCFKPAIRVVHENWNGPMVYVE